MDLPSDVIKIKNDLFEFNNSIEYKNKTTIPELQLREINRNRLNLISTLTSTPEHESMWRSLLRRKDKIGEDWVIDFLDAALDRSTLPNYYYMNNKERNRLREDVVGSFNTLLELIRENRLNHEIQLYESVQKNDTTVLLAQILSSTVKKINEANTRGKAGKTVEATQFIRQLGKRNIKVYGTPLNAVIQIAANSIFKTKYEESDISKLLSR